MIRAIFLCLTFILSNAVVAQAASPLNPVEPKVTKVGAWSTTYAGEAELDGIPVIAMFEERAQSLEVPNFFAGQINTLVPLAPVSKKEVRLVIAALENNDLRAKFELVGRTISLEGNTRFAYVSADTEDDLHFLVVPREDGSLEVSYGKKSDPSELGRGAFSLLPIPTLMNQPEF